MTLPDNLPALLRAEGLTVVTLPGWTDRGRPGAFRPVGVLWHHTGSYDAMADPKDDLAYARWLGLTGRGDLPAPLSQLSISAEGVVYVLAAGRANHAGVAKASGSVASGDGNALYVGVECMNSGSQGWGKPQYDAMVKTGAVLARVLKSSAEAQRAHRETSVTGKWDPGLLDMDRFRADIKARTEPKPKPSRGPRIDAALAALEAERKAAKAAGQKVRLRRTKAAVKILKAVVAK